MKARCFYTVLVSLAITLMLVSTVSFAEERELENYCSADYYGTPHFEVYYNFEDLNPFEMDINDYIMVHTSVGDIKCHFVYDDDGDISLYDSAGNYIRYSVDVEESVATLYLYYYDYDNEENDWKAKLIFPNAVIDNDVTKIVFEPAEITLYSEDILATDWDGSTCLRLGLRAMHSHAGEIWPSAFDYGDKLVVYYQDGRTKTYTNRDYFYDRGVDASYEWADGFISEDEIIHEISIWNADDDLGYDEVKLGDNSFYVKYNGRIANVKVVVKDGHNFGDWETTNQPTCTESGMRERVCKICGEKESEIIPVADLMSCHPSAHLRCQ